MKNFNQIDNTTWTATLTFTETVTRDKEDNKKFHRFAFLKISFADTLAAHLQVNFKRRLENIRLLKFGFATTCKRAAIFHTLNLFRNIKPC